MEDVKIVPIHKKDDTFSPKNYRPVALIPVVSKILERVVFLQFVQYLQENDIIHPNHHAYRAHHNTTTAILQMYDSWLTAVEDGKLAGVCFLDMSAAFDVVDHEILMKKLHLYGFDTDAISWLRSYLTDRRQSVIIDGCLSKLEPVPDGVPQGSILGPLLYTLYVNELPEIIHQRYCEKQVNQEISVWPEYSMACEGCGNTCCYADDTTFSCSDRDPKELSKKLTSMYLIMSEFMINNRLKLNDGKTHLIVKMTSQNRRLKNINQDVKLLTTCKTIEPSETEKL